MGGHKHRVVFVYDGSSNLLGSSTLPGVDTPEGTTVHGNDLWIVDRGQDKVHFFPGGGTRLEGTVAPTTSFAIASSNANPMDLVTDGVHVWVVDDTRKIDRVLSDDH